jgi:purine-nucleoside phosphorylase
VKSPLIGANIEKLGTRFPDMSEVYDRCLQEHIIKTAGKLDIELKSGVYIQTTGPNYETPAEIRMYRALGADAVGMSTACEAMCANHMGMSVMGISCITNMAAGISASPLNHKDVAETADKSSKDFHRLVWNVISGLQTFDKNAMANM